jgi:hypothetical protein
MKRHIAILALLGTALIGCSPSETVEETRPADVKQQISQEQQDEVSAKLKDWKPQK